MSPVQAALPNLCIGGSPIHSGNYQILESIICENGCDTLQAVAYESDRAHTVPLPVLICDTCLRGNGNSYCADCGDGRFLFGLSIDGAQP